MKIRSFASQTEEEDVDKETLATFQRGRARFEISAGVKIDVSMLQMIEFSASYLILSNQEKLIQSVKENH